MPVVVTGCIDRCREMADVAHDSFRLALLAGVTGAALLIFLAAIVAVAVTFRLR